MMKGLHGYVHTETLAIDLAAQQAAVVDTWIGCPVQCPYCRKKCSLSKHESTVKHKCSFHQPIGFGGVKVTANKKSLFITCDEFDNQGRVYIVPDGKYFHSLNTARNAILTGTSPLTATPGPPISSR